MRGSACDQRARLWQQSNHVPHMIPGRPKVDDSMTWRCDHDHMSEMWTSSVLAEIDALPGPQHQPTAFDRDRKMDASQNRSDMRRHVIRTFITHIIITTAGVFILRMAVASTN